MATERLTRMLALVALMVGLYFAVPISQHPPGGLLLRSIVAIVVLLGLAAGVATQVRRSAGDDSRRADGLVGAIVAVLTVFALGFFALEVHRPGQLVGLETRVDALYFSASTMMTIGYGDVHAVGQEARALVLVQMVFDVVFVATAAGLLSSRARRLAADRARRGGASPGRTHRRARLTRARGQRRRS